MNKYKLKDMWNRMPTKDLIISAEGTGKQGDTYYVDDTGFSESPIFGPSARDNLTGINPTVKFDIRVGKDPHIYSANNVSGYFSWGANGGLGDAYANNGLVKFSGNSGWYAIFTSESFNGWWKIDQGNFVDWFSKTAFGGSNYENTPVAAVTHADEPWGSGISSMSYLSCFDSRQLSIDCAWASAKTTLLIPHGDPWITK